MTERENNSTTTSTIAIERFVVSLFFILVALLVVFPMRDYDSFWYMANGRALFETGEIVNKEIFSYTAPGTPFKNIGWLGQYLLYVVFRWGGANGLIFFKTSITLLTSLVLYRTGRMLGTPRILAALLMTLVIYAQLWRFVERPQLFTYLLLALLSMLLHGWRKENIPPLFIWLVPVIMGVWDLFHGSVYGCALLGAMVAGETLCFLLKKKASIWPGLLPLDTSRLRTLYGVTLLSLLLLALNPYGVLHGNMNYFTNLVNGATEAKYIGEYLRPDFAHYIPFWITLTLSVLALFVCGTGLSPVWLAIIIPFGALAIQHCRSIEAFGLVAYPLLAISASRLSWHLQQKRPQLHKMLLIALVIGFSFNLLHFKLVRQNYLYVADEAIDDFSLRGGINEYYFPVGSTRFVIENNLQGNMFNSDRFGGYLAYYLAPNKPIFHYNHPTIFKNLYGFLHKAAERKKYGVTYAIVGNMGEVDLFKQEGFVMVYWEPAAMVLVKPTLENRDVIQRYAIRHFNPLDSAEKFRQIAATPEKFMQIIIEMADYLAYRKDPRLAAIFKELMQTNANLLTNDQRNELVSWASRFNVL